MEMPDIRVGRYKHPKRHGWAGWIEPKDRSWIAFIGLDGRPLVFLNRDENGAILPDDPAEALACLAERRSQRAETGRAGLFIGAPDDGTSTHGEDPQPHEIGEPTHPLGISGGGGEQPWSARASKRSG